MLYLILYLILCAMPLIQGSEKKGVALWDEEFKCEDFQALNNIKWWYNWRCNLNYFYKNNICTSVMDDYESKYVPMVWGFNWKTDYSCHTSLKSHVVMGPNEPNHLNQSNLTPQEVADLWPTMEDNSPGKVLVAPSASKCKPSRCTFGNTTQWFDEFFAVCKDCRVDYIATHTYWCGVDKTMDYLEDLFKRYNRPIWLTEFACKQKKNNATIVKQFMEGILPRLEAAPFVYKYAWFKARIMDDSKYIQTSASLFEADSSTLTPLGNFYNEFEP